MGLPWILTGAKSKCDDVVDFGILEMASTDYSGTICQCPDSGWSQLMEARGSSPLCSLVVKASKFQTSGSCFLGLGTLSTQSAWQFWIYWKIYWDNETDSAWFRRQDKKRIDLIQEKATCHMAACSVSCWLWSGAQIFGLVHLCERVSVDSWYNEL